jgi:hypothetical protein
VPVSKWTRFGAVAVVLAMGVGCGDDDGGPGDLTTSEKAALAEALETTEFGGLASYVIQVVGDVGTLDAGTAASAVNSALAKAMSLSSTGSMAAAYEGAVGIALQFTYDFEGEVFTGWFYGVFGWNDINTSTNSVGEWLLVGGFGEEGTLPSSASGTIEDGDVFAYYALNEVQYFGVSGEASVSSSSFSGSTDCSVSEQGVTVDCSYSTGTMNGSFEFDAERFSGTGSYTQTPITFSGLPALRMTISYSE